MFPLLLTTLMLAIIMLPITTYAADAGSSADTKIIAVEDNAELYSLLDPLTCEEGEQLLPVTINPAEGTAVREGSDKEESIKDVFALSGQENAALTSGSDTENREAVLGYLLQEPCVVHEQGDGTLRAAYPFAIKILFVLLEEGQLEDTFGAINAVYDREGGRYTLQYASQEEAANAYAQLTETWGRDKVLIDLPVAPAETVKYDTTKNDQTYSSFTTAKSLSWGTDVMYLDRLRDWAEDNPAQGTLKVAVIDGGIRVDETNEEIIDGYGIDASRILKSYCQSITSSFYNYTALHDYSDSGWQPKKCSYADLKGHGTHVMSTVLDGTPSQVKVFAIRDSCTNPQQYNSTRYATGDIDGMVKSVARAGERGAKVVNMSQGINCYDYETETWKGYYGKGITEMENITFDTFCYYNNEIAHTIGTYDLCVVTAAGNSGKNTSDLMLFPAMNNGVVEVSNLTYNNGFVLNSGSNFGENVSFCAPGTAIVGAGYDWDTHKACYTTKTGTSMATPHITAALAILRLYNPNLDNLGTVELLKQYCTDLGDTGRDDKYGYGFPQFKQWYTMTFVYNDFVTDSVDVSLPMGMKLNRPEDPERFGYSFGGWYTDTAFTQKYDFSKPVKKADSLYAKWTRVYKQVVYHYNGHGGTTRSESIPQGEDIPRPTDPRVEGWKFLGWYSDPELTTEFYFSTPIYESIDLYAKWEKIAPKAITPAVTLSAASYTYDGTVKTPAVTVKDGSTVLKKNTDYTVSYSAGRKNAGTYKVTIQLKGNYTGTAAKTFKINPAAQKITAKSYTKVLGAKAFNLGAKRTVGNGKLTYKSSNKKVATVSTKGLITVKGIGKATITITAAKTANYKVATKKVTITVNPKATTMSKVTAASKAFTATWKKQATQTTGYQIQYSQSSTFASGNKTALITKNTTVTKKVTGLTAKKKYYVRVRTYKTVGSTKYYSAWSKALAVTTKA